MAGGNMVRPLPPSGRPSPSTRISAIAINQLAYVHAKIGQFDEALRLFERYAAISPGDANPLDSIGELYVRMGKLDLAEAKYRKALEMRPDFFTSCASLSYVSCLRENYAGGLIAGSTSSSPGPRCRRPRWKDPGGRPASIIFWAGGTRPWPPMPRSGRKAEAAAADLFVAIRGSDDGLHPR